MKRIEAFIRPERLSAVMDALRDAGHTGMTVADVHGRGDHGPLVTHWNGQERAIELLPKIAVVVVVEDGAARDCVDAIVSSARSHRVGDGKIFVTPVDEAVRISTGESGTAAL